MRLDLFGIHVLAARKDNDVFAASCDNQISVCLDESEIPRSQPAIFNGFGSFPNVVVVALHQDGTANPHLADPFFIWRIDADRHTAQWLSDGAKTVRANWSDGRGRRGFG